MLYPLLFPKLEYYGIKDPQLNVFKTFLTGRVQQVVFDNKESTFLEILAGLQQGSVLGPPLFVLVINDLPSLLPGRTLLYVDDTSFEATCDKFEAMVTMLDYMMKAAGSWFEANYLSINESKTDKICFSLKPGTKNSNFKDSVKLLGVHLDSKLTWEVHTQQISNKLSRVIYLLRKLKNCVSQNMLIQAYHSFFHSHLLYANILWGNSSGAAQVFLWQKKAVRILAGISQRESCKPFFTYFNIMTLPSIFIYSNLVYVRENLTEFIPRARLHSYGTRGSSDLDVPITRLQKTIRSHKVMQVKLFNNLGLASRSLEVNTFKRKLAKWLIDNALYSVKEFYTFNNVDLV